VKRNGKQLLSLLAPCLLLSTGGPALVHLVTQDTCVDKPETTRDAVSTAPNRTTTTATRPAQAKREADDGVGALPMVAVAMSC